jgi:uroporphyrinogen-III decarboxylase
MNSIERVKAALNFNSPDRIPVANFMLPTGIFTGDVAPLPLVPSKSWRPGWGEGEERLFPHSDLTSRWNKPEWAKDPQFKNWRKIPHQEIDEWGCIWEVDGKNTTMGHPGRASLTNMDKIDEYRDRYFPDPADRTQYRLAKLAKAAYGARRYRMAILGIGPLTMAMNMLGLSRFLVEHRKNPEKLAYLLGEITENIVSQMKNFVKNSLEPHGFWLPDDLGEQTRELMSVKLFKKFYEPLYRRLYSTAHDLGTEFHQHCCGKIDKYIPLLIDWGLDALEFDSPRMTGYPDLKPYRGKIMFWGCVNIQSIYVTGTPAEVEREVWLMMKNLGTKRGGYGAYFYPTPEHIQTPKENIKAFKNGIKKYGNYSQIPNDWWEVEVPAALPRL